MKYFLVFFVLTLSLISYSQITKKKIIKDKDLKYKSFRVATEKYQIVESSKDLGYGLEIKINLGLGTGFVIKYKKNYFLVTNYHVITGRAWEDTSFFMAPKRQEEWEILTATFYSKNDDKYEYVPFYLHDENGNRTYLSVPANTDNKKISPDIAFIKLDSLPGETVISPIVLPTKTEKWEIPANTQLYCYGYSKRAINELYPFCDSIYSVGDSSFSNKDCFISVYNPPHMHGSSGSPVYLKKNNKYYFVGVQFCVVPAEWQRPYSHVYDFLFPLTNYTNPIGFIITVDYLKESLDLLLGKK